MLEKNSQSQTNFTSLLFLDTPTMNSVNKDTLQDLHLEEIIETIVENDPDDQEFLASVLKCPLESLQEISYRQEVFVDLQVPILLDSIKKFTNSIKKVERSLVTTSKLQYRWYQYRYLLDTSQLYCDTITELTGVLNERQPTSRGLTELSLYLDELSGSQRFIDLAQDINQVAEALKEVQYSMVIDVGRVDVRLYKGESDIRLRVEKVFNRFMEDDIGTYRQRRLQGPTPYVNHIEAQVLEGVSKLHPKAFGLLQKFWNKWKEFLDPNILTIARDLRFYLAVEDLATRLRSSGLNLTLPEIVANDWLINVDEGFDLALTLKLMKKRQRPVCNDICIGPNKRIAFIVGPNSGGKTTFARQIGQLLYLAHIGCPVPGDNVQVPLIDNILTIFERGEAMDNPVGKLQDELLRLKAVLDEVTPRSLIVLNELFSSTTLQDAQELAHLVIDQLGKVGAFCVWVTFIDGLSQGVGKAQRFVTQVQPEDPTIRTYKVLAGQATYTGYAKSIAEKYRLDQASLRRRLWHL